MKEVTNIPQSVELPDLLSTEFNMSTADVTIGTGEPGLLNPILTLEGEDGGFIHTFENGHFKITENDTESNSGSSRIVMENIAAGNMDIGNIVIESGSFYGGDSDSTTVTAKDVAKRKASLLLPFDHSASHHVGTRTGNVELEQLTSKVLRVASRAGHVAINGAQAEDMELETRSGPISVKDTRSENPVSVKTRSGHLNVSGCEAPSWKLSTRAGDVTVENTRGTVDATTRSGRTRVS